VIFVSYTATLSAGAATGAAGAAGAAGAMLPSTGFGTAAVMLLAVSLVGVGAALLSLVRRPANARP
jgi:LPXTG-motif cell wall-anchored protein